MAYSDIANYLARLKAAPGRATMISAPELDLDLTDDYFTRGGAPGRGRTDFKQLAASRRAETGYDMPSQARPASRYGQTDQPSSAGGATDVLRGFVESQRETPIPAGTTPPYVPPLEDDPFRGPMVSSGMLADMGEFGGVPVSPSDVSQQVNVNRVDEGPGFFKRLLDSGWVGAFGRGLSSGSPQGMSGAMREFGLDRERAQLAEAEALRLEEEAVEERRIRDEDRAAQKKVNETIQEITGGWDETTTPEQKISDYQRAFNTAIGNGDHALAGRIREMTAYLSEGPEAGPAVRYDTWDQTEGRAPDGTPTRVREVAAGAPGTISDRQYFDKDVYLEQIGEGVDAAEAARNSWRTGGMIVDPDEVKAAAAEAETRTGQERLNARLGEAAYDGLMLMVTDPATVNPETGETIPGQPNFNDYIMAGAVQQLDGSWEQGTPADPEAWQAFLASLISNAGSETTGFGGKLLGFFGRSAFLKDNPEILTGYTNALNYINPTVRFLSGAQMTNQEAMRYYNALIPAPGDPIPVIEMKRRKRDVLTNAMGGPGISDTARRRAREALDLDEDELMVHEHGAFGGDRSGQEAADYYLARLITAVGITDMTDYSDVRRQVGAAGGVLGSDLTIGGNP